MSLGANDFTASLNYKRRIVAELDACQTRKEKTRVLRRESLHESIIAYWRRQLREPPKPEPTPSELIEAAFAAFGLESSSVSEYSYRRGDALLARCIAAYLLRRACGLTYNEIAKLFARSISTVYIETRHFRERLNADPELRARLAPLFKQFGVSQRVLSARRSDACDQPKRQSVRGRSSRL